MVMSFSRGTKCRGVYRYAHVMFELSFYLTKLVLTALFINTIPPTNPRTDTAIEEGTFFLLIFPSILLTTITGIPSATSYSNEDTASQVVPSSSCCFFLSTEQEGFIDLSLVLLRCVSMQRGVLKPSSPLLCCLSMRRGGISPFFY
jgi:hypothetical protein